MAGVTSSPMRPLLCCVAEGQPVDAMVRAAEFVLALAQQTRVWALFGCRDVRPPWRRALSMAQQRALHALTVAELSAVPAGTQQVWLWPGPRVPSAPPPSTWLVLTHSAAAVDPVALAAYQRVFVLPAPPPEWEQVTAEFWQIPAAVPAPRELEAGSRRVRLFSDVAQVQAAPPLRDTLLLVCPAESAQVEAPLLACMGHYSAVQVETGRSPGFLVQLLRAGVRHPLQSWAGDLQTLLPRLQGWEAIDVLHLADSRDAVERSARAVEVWLRGAALPRVLLHVPKGDIHRVQSIQMMGIGVATDGITSGLQSAAAGRFTVRWLAPQSPLDARGRIYYYPFAPQVGLDGDEIDYPSLPGCLQRDEIDLICCIDPTLSGMQASRALWARRAVPVVGMLHSLHPASLATEALWAPLVASSYPFDGIVSPTRCGAEAYRGLLAAAAAWWRPRSAEAEPFAGDIAVIPYGIDGAPYLALDRASCRAALGFGEHAVVLLSLGRLNRQEKGDLLPLLLAVRALRRGGLDVQLLVAGARGGGTYDMQLQAQATALGIGAALHVRPDLAAEDKPLLYGAADVFVALSDNIQETYGLTLLEAMAASLPVVAAGWNGYREIVRHGETGFLVPTYGSWVAPRLTQVQRLTEGPFGYGHRDLHETVATDVLALQQLLEQLVIAPEARHRMGAAGHAVWRADHEMHTQGRRLAEFLLTCHSRAATWDWTPPTKQPFFDDVGRRFAAYPSHGWLPDSAPLTRGELRLDLWEGRQERHLAASVCRYVEEAGEATVAEVMAYGMAQGKLPRAEMALRLARYLKLGALKRTQPMHDEAL